MILVINILNWISRNWVWQNLIVDAVFAILLYLCSDKPTITICIACVLLLKGAGVYGIYTDELGNIVNPHTAIFINVSSANVVELAFSIIAIITKNANGALLNTIASISQNVILLPLISGMVYLIRGGCRDNFTPELRSSIFQYWIVVWLLCFGSRLDSALAHYLVFGMFAVSCIIKYLSDIWTLSYVETDEENGGTTDVTRIILTSLFMTIGAIESSIASYIILSTIKVSSNHVWFYIAVTPILGNLIEHLVAIKYAWRKDPKYKTFCVASANQLSYLILPLNLLGSRKTPKYTALMSILNFVTVLIKFPTARCVDWIYIDFLATLAFSTLITVI